MNLPIIDISSWTDCSSSAQLRQEAATSWNNAMRDYGFAVITGHGIEESSFAELNKQALEFFSQPSIDRMKYSRGGYGHPLGGYTPAGRENVENSFDETSKASSATKKSSDPVENFVFTSPPCAFIAPDGCSPSPIASADAYYAAMNNLLRILHRISCVALAVNNQEFFDKYYDSTLPGNESKGKNGNCLRLANYFPRTVTIPSSSKDDIRYGAHTDFQGFTILRPDKTDWHSRSVFVKDREYLLTCGGLEVFNRMTNEWIPVKIPQHLNALVVNAGDLFQRWTNDYWLSPIHRVVSSPTLTPALPSNDGTFVSDDNDSERVTVEIPGRQAIVFFSGPLEDAVVEVLPLPHILQHRGGEVYPPVRSGDWLQMKINKINT